MLGLVAFFAATSVAAAATIEGTTDPSAWHPNSANITTAESVTFKVGTLAHGVAFDAPPATPSCPGVVGSPGQANWEGTCTFSQAGSYPFHCTVHAGMTGTVTVTSSGPGAPIVSTESATSISDTGATLQGSVNPNGLATTYFFEYGTTTSYDHTTEPPSSAGSGTSPVGASTPVTGLSAGTTYHFRLVANNTSGTREGVDKTFTTTGPPLATTNPATGIGATGATLQGSVNPRGHPTTYFFEYGTTAPAYGQKTTAKPAGSGTASVVVSEPLTGLSPNTTFHFRLVAKNDVPVEVPGADRTFTTLAPDTTDPQTTIKTKPADPTNSSTVEFTYESNEPGSTFECKMDGESFTACASTGKTYTGLGEGLHTFQVRATDPSLNTDESPAGYSFSVVLPVTQPEVTPPKVEPPPTVEPPPAVAPNTTITFKPKAKTKDRTPTFKFKSTVAGATFKCTIDAKALKPCRSPLTTKKLSFGRHTLKVSAVLGGGSDPTPAAFSFKVLKP
jgi:plastocyanin